MGIQVENNLHYNACGMQKSRSSSSVVQSVSKRLWRTRSRSSSRIIPTWSPQGSCCWADGCGRVVRLTDTSVLALTEVERKALQQAALARLHQMNLGISVKIPEENAAVATKPKRRAYLLKRKAITTGFFDQGRAKDSDKDKGSDRAVFGVPLGQCVESERAARRRRLLGSRASLTSLGGIDKTEDSESCDSSEWGWAGSEDLGGRVPALVTACLDHLRRHGLHTLGLFRVSASKKRVRQLREDWERTQEAALDSAVCPHDVATLLKEFLRDLPDPLLCRDLYPAFLQTQKIANRRLQWEALRLICWLLPPAHRDTLEALLNFLGQLAEHSSDTTQPGNKMDAPNLATVFAPNILHKNKPNETAGTEQLSERADVINVMRLLLERRAELWPLPAELLHEAYAHLARSAPAHLDALLLRRADKSRGSLEEGQSTPASSVRVDSAADSADSASDYNETIGGSDDDNCVITASLHIPAAGRRPAAPPRRRHSIDRRDKPDSGDRKNAADRRDIVDKRDFGDKRDSAVGSSSASAASSPPASPPPAPLKVTLTAAGELKRPMDIDRLTSYGRERHTSDSRAVVLRQHDESSTSRSRVRREEHRIRREESTSRREESISRREEHRIRREDNVIRREGTTLYKRGELISSARNSHS